MTTSTAWPTCTSCGDGFEPRPPGSPGPQEMCRRCSRLCRACGSWFTTTSEERAANEEAQRRYLKRRVRRPLPCTLPELCVGCRPPQQARPRRRRGVVLPFVKEQAR